VADLLTGILVTSALLTAASWWLDRLRPPWIVVGLGGVAIPDLVKVRLLVDGSTVESLLGMPFSWGGIETIGGVALLAGAITMAFDRRWWPRVYSLLIAGGAVGLLLDGLRMFADGRSGTWLFPLLPTYRPPTPGLFVTSDLAVPAVAALAAALVFAADRYLVDRPTWHREG
jgi:hypothetical protein